MSANRCSIRMLVFGASPTRRFVEHSVAGAA